MLITLLSYYDVYHMVTTESPSLTVTHPALVFVSSRLFEHFGPAFPGRLEEGGVLSADLLAALDASLRSRNVVPVSFCTSDFKSTQQNATVPILVKTHTHTHIEHAWA